MGLVVEEKIVQHEGFPLVQPDLQVQGGQLEEGSDEYALIWLLSKHTKDSGSEKIYLKDMVKELNLPLPKVTAIARSLQGKGLVRWTHDGNGEDGTYILLTDTALTSVQTHRQTLRKYHQRVVSAFGEERFLHLLSEIAQLEEILRQEAEKVGDEP